MSKKPKDSKGKTKGRGLAPVGRSSKAAPAQAAAPRTGGSVHPAAPSKGGEKAKEGKAAAGVAAGTPKRKLGLRGAAPWAARHAAKHAAEARARAAEPPPPGSARATIRVPNGAEEIKAKIAELHNSLVQIRVYRKNLAKGFYDVGNVLRDIQNRKLYEAKGYGSFEAFLEREIDLGKTTSLKLVRVVGTFLKEAALEHGMDALFQAISALDSIAEPGAKAGPTPPPPQQSARIALPMKPPLGRVG